MGLSQINHRLRVLAGYLKKTAGSLSIERLPGPGILATLVIKSKPHYDQAVNLTYTFTAGKCEVEGTIGMTSHCPPVNTVDGLAHLETFVAICLMGLHGINLPLPKGDALIDALTLDQRRELVDLLAISFFNNWEEIAEKFG